MPARIAGRMRIHAGERLYLANSPADAVAAIALPAVQIAKRLAGKFDHIVLFAKTQRELDTRFPRLKAHLDVAGKLWIAWPKGGQLDTDLDLKARDPHRVQPRPGREYATAHRRHLDGAQVHPDPSATRRTRTATGN